MLSQLGPRPLVPLGCVSCAHVEHCSCSRISVHTIIQRIGGAGMNGKSKTKTKTKTSPEPRRHETPAASSITAPPLKRHAVLPLVDVGSRQFEEICRDLLRQNYPDLRPAMKRRGGLPQFGVDVEGFNDLQEPEVVVSAKCYRDIEPWEFRAWIEDFTKHLDGHWKGKGVKEFIIAVSIERNNDDMNDAARELARQLATKNIKFRIWDSVELSEMLAKDPRLIDRYFNESWVKALSAQVAIGPGATAGGLFSTRGPTASQGAILSQIESLYAGPLNQMLSTTLDAAIAELRRGRRSKIKRWLEDARADVVTWQGAEPELKAKGLRVAAMVILAEGDQSGAEQLLDEADSFAPAPDRTHRAYLIRAKSGGGAARTYLQNPDGRRERELMAALLIEGHEPNQALEQLAPLIGDDASAEVLRLRAMATLMAGGSRSDAIKQVTSATAKEPESAMALFARGAVRLACALVNGAEMQFGGVPNPISRSSVRSTPEARGFLAQAAADFDRLLETVEGDFRREVEVWKLAALLLNPEARAAGRSFARSLFSRDDYDPAAVAWALLDGLPLRQGRIRKTLVDALRAGDGTPSHVAVVALLAAGASHPERGMAVVNKYAGMFPGANDFFDHWRGQFATRDDIESFSAVMRHTLASKDVGPLFALLTAGHVPVENLLAGSEMLASMDAFKELDALRDRLVHLGSSRAVELAAVAALNNGDPRASITILNDARTAGIDMSRRLSYIRLKAWEALGSHRELIDDIHSLLSEQEDPLLRDELLNAYLRIGSLDGIREQAELVLKRGEIDQRKAVQVALALRSYAPDVARQALEGISTESFPDDLSSIVLELSSRLGLASLQDEMIGKMIANPAGTKSFQRFESVEDVLKFIEEHAKEYRSRLDQWMHGLIPAAAAMRGDLKDYISLFLAEPSARQNRLGDPLPMMLVSGRSREAAALPPEGRPALRLDLSALLIAARCELLDDIEHCFEIQLPESVPEALVLAAAEFHEVLPLVAEAVKALSRGESAVEICQNPPDGIVELHAFQAEMEEEQKVAAAHALHEAYLAGHVLKSRLDELLAVLGLAAPPAKPGSDRLLLGRGAVVALAQLGVLEQLARGFTFMVTQKDVKSLLDQLLKAEAEQRIRAMLLDLTKTVSEKLAASAWKTVVPKRSIESIERARSLPSHLRCLMETLPEEDEVGKFLFWIEDRTLSQQPISHSLTLSEIIFHLSRNNMLSRDRLSKLHEDLRRWGYLFMPIDIEHLASIIEASPVADYELVENASLSEVRRWFACDVKHLIYLEQRGDVDSQGRISGEVRRTLDLSGLSRDLLARIWRSRAGSDGDRVARSNWIWANLRVTHLPPPVGADTTDGLRSIASLTAVQALTLPIQAELQGARLPENANKAYMEWALSSAIGPMVDADPELLNVLAKTASAMLARIVECDEAMRSEPDGEEIAKACRIIVRRFLSLLPEEWEARITGGDLNKALGIERVMLISIDEQHQLSVRVMEDAVTKCLQDGTKHADIKLHNGSTKARLELAWDDQGIPTGLLKIGKRKLPLHKSTLALVYPLQSVRQRLLNDFVGKGSVGRPLTVEYLAALAKEEDVEKRVEDYHRYMAADFARRKNLMAESISCAGTIRVTDLDLPSVGEMLNYLGLPTEFRGSPQELVGASFEALRTSLGIGQAMRRLSSLPVEIPKEHLVEFAKELSGNADTWAREESLLSACFWQVSQAASGQLSAGDDEAWLQRSITNDRARLLAALVRHGTRQALASEEWRGLPPDFSLCLIWVFADQLGREFSSSNIDLSQFTAWMAQNSRSGLFEFERESIWEEWAINMSLRLTAPLLIARVASRLLSLGAAIPEHLKALIGNQVEERWTPYPEVLVPTATAAPDDFWAAKDPMLLIITAGWLAEGHPFRERDQERLLQRIFEETKESDPTLFATLVSLLVDVGTVHSAQLDGIREKLDQALAALGAKAEPAYTIIVDLIAQIYARKRDAEGFAEWVRNQAELASTLKCQPRLKLSDEQETGRVLAALLNAIYVLT